MGAGLVEPEHRRRAGGAGPGDGELHPVAGSGRPWSGTCARCRRPRRCARGAWRPAVDDAHGAGGGDLEGLVVAAVLLGRLRHEPDVGDRAHGGGVVGAVGPAVVDHDLVDPGVAAVGDDGLGVVLGRRRRPTCGPTCGSSPASTRRRSTSLGTCRLVMPRSESTIASAGPVGEALLHAGLDGGLAVAGSASRLSSSVPRPSFGLMPASSRAAPCSANSAGKNASHGVPEDDRVGHLHHRGLEVQREQHALGLGVGDLLGRGRRRSGRLAHDRGVDDLAGQHRDRRLAGRWWCRRRRPARCGAIRRRRPR